MLDGNKIDHPDQLETTEGHHADNSTDDLGPDQRREDEGQRAACAPRQPDFFLRKSSSLLGGLARVDWMFTLANTAYHLVRLSAD